MIPIKGHNDKMPAGTVRYCPFCGGDNIWSTGRHVYNELVAEHGSACIELGCGDCNASLTAFSGEHTGKTFDQLLAVAVNKWNARADKWNKDTGADA